jgi:hypothetical protein
MRLRRKTDVQMRPLNPAIFDTTGAANQTQIQQSATLGIYRFALASTQEAVATVTVDGVDQGQWFRYVTDDRQPLR